MTACLQRQGLRLHADWRGLDCVTLHKGSQRLGRGSCKDAPRHSLPILASRHSGESSGAEGQPEFAGKNFVYAFAGARDGLEYRQRSPGLMVAINWCDDEMGRIIPGESVDY